LILESFQHYVATGINLPSDLHAALLEINALPVVGYEIQQCLQLEPGYEVVNWVKVLINCGLNFSAIGTVYPLMSKHLDSFI
jgi:hypothetical protein